MKTFKTAKGTELPLLDLRGKDYLQVAHRVLWFREEHPDWCIDTQVTIQENSAIGRARILNAEGKLIATGTKFEDVKRFQDYIEKSETGAVGRALALCGYGTQFAVEMDEGERLADSPVPSTRSSSTAVAPSTEARSLQGGGKLCVQCGKNMAPSKFKQGDFYCPDKNCRDKHKNAAPLRSGAPEQILFEDDIKF